MSDWDAIRLAHVGEDAVGIPLTEQDPDLTNYEWYEWVMEKILEPKKQQVLY